MIGTRLKYGILLVVMALITIAAVASTRGNKLFSNGMSDYSIVLTSHASESEQTAAKELQNYIQQVGGVELAIVNEAEADIAKPHIFVGYSAEYGRKMGVEQPEAGSQRYTYCNVGRNLWIYGGSRWGTMYGVYSFLENELGVRWYPSNVTIVRPLKEWRVKKIFRSEAPAIEYRFVDFYDVENDGEWLARNKCNFVWKSQQNKYGGLAGFWGGHTFDYFVPAAKYFANHPEYFSLRDGKRIAHGQLCLSNPEVLKLCMEGMTQVIAQNPAYWIYSLSQNDNQLPCQCDECRKLEQQYGGHSGILLWFVNQVADVVKEKYPDKYISTFAYQYTRQVPSGITPRENVVIRLCSIECCFAHPMHSCEQNTSFMQDLKRWSEVASHLYIWDYVVNFRQYIAPCPNFGVLAENIKTFQRYRTIGLHEEGQYESLGGAFSELKSWLLAKLMWNPNLDTAKLVKEFISDFYGGAAPYVQQYFDLCEQLVTAKEHFGLFFLENSPIYSDEFVDKARSILARAKQEVADCNEQLRHRVDLVALQVDYLYVMRQPKAALADGTRDYLFDFLRRYNIKAIEWNSVENYINWYNAKYLGIENENAKYKVPIDR